MTRCEVSRPIPRLLDRSRSALSHRVTCPAKSAAKDTTGKLLFCSIRRVRSWTLIPPRCRTPALRARVVPRSTKADAERKQLAESFEFASFFSAQLCQSIILPRETA